MVSNVDVTVASKTYRKVVSKTAEALRVDPKHTQHPREDFENMLEIMDEKSRERALKLYRLGLRRGFDEATTAIVDKKIYFEENNLICPEKIIIKSSIKFRGQERTSQTFEFTAEELGFKTK